MKKCPGCHEWEQFCACPLKARPKPRWFDNLSRLRAPGKRRAHLGKPSKALSTVLSEFKKRKGSLILDVGCGDSGDRIVAASRGFITYGIDLFPISLRNTQGFLFGNANALPFADGTFDAVICHAVLSLLSPDDRVRFYDEAARVLRPTGVFAIKRAAEREGIVDTAGNWHVEWSSQEDDIALVMDVLAVRGLLHRVPVEVDDSDPLTLPPLTVLPPEPYGLLDL